MDTLRKNSWGSDNQKFILPKTVNDPGIEKFPVRLVKLTTGLIFATVVVPFGFAFLCYRNNEWFWEVGRK